MTEHIANVLTEHMFADGLIECDDKEIYHYAIQVLIEKIIGFSTIFLFSIMWGVFLETVFFLLCFSCLRKHTGGFHSESYAGCFIGTTGIYIIYVKLLYPIFLKYMNINIVEAFETPVPQEVNATELVKAEDLPIDAPAASMLDLEAGTQLIDADGVQNPARMARSDSGVIQSLTGAIANEGEFAYYIVTLAPRQIVSATMACPQNPDLNYDLFLYEVDENGYLGNILNASTTETYMNTYSDGTVKTMDESLAYINNTAETKNYAVIVLATKGGSASDTFKLTLSMDEDGSYDIFEYNNSPYDAFELPELTVDGLRVSKLSLHTANDQDWFLLRNTSSEISLASIEPERLDMQKYQIEVYTADGSKMKLARKSNGLYSIQPGVNYIKVCADETGFTSSGYQLLITGLSNSPSKVEYILNP